MELFDFSSLDFLVFTGILPFAPAGDVFLGGMLLVGYTVVSWPLYMMFETHHTSNQNQKCLFV